MRPFISYMGLGDGRKLQGLNVGHFGHFGGVGEGENGLSEGVWEGDKCVGDISEGVWEGDKCV